MKSRAIKSATADLFADVKAQGVSTRGAPARALVPAPAHQEPPPSQGRSRSRSKHVWYAVVFLELAELERAADSLRRLCLHAQQFTSWVSIEMPNALLLEIHGSVRLFGSLEKLHADLDSTWNRLGLRAQSAAAPSTLAALWLARAGKRALIRDAGMLASALAELPITCTAWDAERLQTLRALGVTRLGELLRLPRAGVARRFSPAALDDLDIALARRAAPRRSFVPRERFRARVDFEMDIETAVYVQKALEPLARRCAKFLRERQAGVQALELRLRHRALPATRLRLGLASITSEYRRLMDVLQQKLSRLELVAPALGMELISGPLQPLSAASLDVFAPRGAGGSRDTAPQLVERLRARLGEAAVYGLGSIPEHRPEAAWQRIHELRLEGPAAMRGPFDAGMPRPLWLLDMPALLQKGDWILEEGPERIESGWWDGKDVARDYYIARQQGGTRWWVFQELKSKSWYLHGVFA